MPDYKNGKIYQLVCNETREVYIGSTTRSLEDRLSTHKKSSNKCYSKQIIDRNNYYIELLETYPCNNQFELDRKEGEYQRTIECINHNIAGRTRKEWEQDNKEAIAKYHKEYKEYNKETIVNYRKEYYQDNKEAIFVHNKEYYQNNSETIIKQKHEYNQNNKEAIKAQKSKVVICECGIKSTKGTLAKHRRSKKHIALINLETIKPPVCEVVVCECGIETTKQNIARHKLTKKHINLMANI